MIVAALGSLLIVILDVVGGVLGIQAQISQNKGKHVKVLFFECKEPSHEAYKLGIAAVVLLGLAHLIANLLGGCKGICSRERNSSFTRKLASAALIFSWLVFLVGFSLLLIGALSNSKSRATCGLARHNFLAIGGILCFVHAVFAVTYGGISGVARWKEKRARKKDVPAHINKEEEHVPIGTKA